MTGLVAVLAALACGLAGGLAGLGVPPLLATLPGPAGAVAERPRLRTHAVLLAGAAGAVVGLGGPRWSLLLLLPLVPLGVALALVDAHTHLLPTRLIRPGLGAALVLSVAAALLADDPAALLRGVVAGAATFAVFHALWWIQPAGMGYGDVRLSALVGLVLGHLGWAPLLAGVYGAFVVFAAAAVARAARRRDRGALREPLPFGPFLLTGALGGIALAGPLLGGHLVGG